ncbi:MAG: VWA domain-containing protein [Acidobacteria bacterium]|nr:VWA domain-containing protein [Acidobacteriota bacterium]
MALPSLEYAGLIGTLLFGVVAAAAPGQSPDRQSGPARFRAGVDLVVLDVCVRDGTGRFLPDLSADDFIVLEDGAPQRISFLVPSSAVPLTAVLLVDVSQSMWGSKLTRALEAARTFAELLGPNDRIAMIAFSHRAIRLHDFSDDPAHVPEALSPPSIRALLSSRDLAMGLSTAVYDALLVGASELRQTRGGAPAETREVIILLSDGEDNSSRVGFEEVLPALRRSGALVYSVSLQADDRGEWLGATWPMLQLARDTGARAMGVPRLEALPELYRDIDAEVRHLYRLAYVSTNSRQDGWWRTISVRVPARDARVRTRAGYYAPRAVASSFGGQ